MDNLMSTHDTFRDSRSPTLAPATLSLETTIEMSSANSALEPITMSAAVPIAQKSNAEMQAEIGSLLDEPARREFVNTIKYITRLGSRKPKMVETRRQKLREIVMANKEIVQLYNAYASAQAAAEKRVTYRLPVFDDLEIQGEIYLTGTNHAILGRENSGGRSKDEHSHEPEEYHELEQEENVITGTQDCVLQQKTHAKSEKNDSHSPGLPGAGTTNHPVEQIEPALNDEEEMQEENYSAPDTSKDAKLDATPPDQDIEYAQAQHIEMQEEGQIAIDTDEADEADTINTTHQEFESVHDNDTEILDMSESGTTTSSAKDTKNHLQGVVDIMQVAHKEAAAQRSPTRQISHPLKTVEYPSYQANAIQPNAGSIAEIAIDAVEQKDQAPGPLPKAHQSVTPVRNPEAFPIDRLQSVQAQYYPSAKVINIWTHRDSNGFVVRVTADLQDGPVNHFVIDDARIITGLGLREDVNDTILLHKASFKPDETFTFEILYNQHARNLDTFIVGRFQSARHAYLYWLDLRKSADPKYGPFVLEARRLAKQLGRRVFDVWGEIDRYWRHEQGSGGRKFREDRLHNLVEDPVYDATVKTSSKVAMW
jgi:hypothetical protein